MTFCTRLRLGGTLVALGLGLASFGAARAQQAQPSATGLVMGEVDKCAGGTETPVPGVYVGVAGGEPNMARTDPTGQFVLALLPGQYTVQAAADDGTSASRPYVPVEADSSLDIGVLELAGGCAGNDIQAPPAPAPAQPTVAPTATPEPPTPEPPTPTAVPTQPAADATPAPAVDQQAPDDSTPDEQAPPSDEAPDA